PAETPITATRMGVSVGPEVAVDYQFHPNFSAGLHLDFLYTVGLAQSIKASRIDAEMVPNDFDIVPNAVQALRLGAGLHATLMF
ncbi:MAG: hypothetical protein FJZ01_19550, partial [Candidatus Sericytochromatia bacterium]|nr:hypothetical protein [Candidatus Tanganyikabacteria bacterium]